MVKSEDSITNKHYKIIKAINIIGYLCLIIWPAFLLASLMSFDAPGSDEHIAPYIIVSFAISQPFQIIIFPFISKNLLKKQKTKTAYILSLIPVIPFALLLLLPPIMGTILNLAIPLKLN